MKTGPEQALFLIDQILKEEIESLLPKDLETLTEYKEVCVRKILPILALEVTQIKEGDPWDPKKLQGSLKLASFFEEDRAFDWMIQLHEFTNELEQQLDPLFISLYWADILAGVGFSSIAKIKTHLENIELDEQIREACADALLVLVAKNIIHRSDLVEYFKSLYGALLSGTLIDPILASILVEASLCIWPGESIEEIKELYGIGLANDEFTSLSDVLEAIENTDAFCLETFREWTLCTHILYPLVRKKNSEEEDDDDEFMNYFDSSDSTIDFDTEEFEEFSTLVNELRLPPLLSCPEIQKLPQKEQKRYASIPNLLLENPEEVINITSDILLKYAPISTLFNYLYQALVMLDEKVRAMNTLKQWIKLFPDDFFAKVEYAHYFLRRGEPDKVKDLLSNRWTLSSLYPEKSSFEDLEHLKFFHLLGCYYITIGDVEKAEGYLQLIDAMNPNSFEYYHLHEQLENYSSRSSFKDSF